MSLRSDKLLSLHDPGLSWLSLKIISTFRYRWIGFFVLALTSFNPTVCIILVIISLWHTSTYSSWIDIQICSTFLLITSTDFPMRHFTCNCCSLLTSVLLRETLVILISVSILNENIVFCITSRSILVVFSAVFIRVVLRLEWFTVLYLLFHILQKF